MEFAGKLGRESNYGPRGRCNRHNASKGKGVQDDCGCEYIWLAFGWVRHWPGMANWPGTHLHLAWLGTFGVAGDTPRGGRGWGRGWGHSTPLLAPFQRAGDQRAGTSGLGTHPTLAYAIDRSCL